MKPMTKPHKGYFYLIYKYDSKSKTLLVRIKQWVKMIYKCLFKSQNPTDKEE